MVKAKLASLSNWPLSLSEKMRSDRTYIIPTRFGLYYGISMLLLLAVAYIYTNNIIYFICFFLISFGHLSMWSTHFNISRLNIKILATQDFFADELGKLRIQVENTGEKTSSLLNLRTARSNDSQEQELAEVQRKSNEACEISIKINKRGMQKIPAIILESTYPFGLLRSWKIIRSTQAVLVYPKREGANYLPESSQNSGEDNEGKKFQQANENIFQGHKPYQDSDSIRRIDWKAFARTQHLLIKQFESESKGSLQLRWDSLGHLSFEKKISQLTLWVVECEKQNRFYQLFLPHFTSPLSKGPSHSKECLTKLALFENTNEN